MLGGVIPRRLALPARAAIAEAHEELSWFCATCDRMIEEGQPGPHCRYCADYWNDVAAGLFVPPHWSFVEAPLE